MLAGDPQEDARFVLGTGYLVRSILLRPQAESHGPASIPHPRPRLGLGSAGGWTLAGG
jgi:hypothetical protein